MGGTVRLAIIHRNRLFRECLDSVLSAGKRFQVIHLDHTGLDHLKGLEEELPDVILIDLGLPHRMPIELTQHFGQRVEGPKVILLAHAKALLTPGDTEDKLVECLAAGAEGCVLEESSLEELQAAIEKVIAGEKAYSPELVPSMCDRLVQAARGASWRERVKSVDLTQRELEVVSLIAEGLSNKQIARRLSLSLYTVKNHVHNIVEKLQVENRFEAVRFARQRGWLEKLKVLGPANGGR